jgi:filamentous hemagglutinin family protein
MLASMTAWMLSYARVIEAQVTTSITSTTGTGNLGTTVTHQVGSNLYNITNGTRPGGGPNLFHSFGDFSIGAGDIGNFLNNTGLPTSNILGRVTGGNISNIYGTIQTTGFNTANLFLMNPSGIVLGPSASLNVGGSVSFTTAQYIRLFDGVSSANFYSNPANDGLANSILAIDPSAFEFLSASPAAYGFLTTPDSDATIIVQGSALSVPLGQAISLVGGKVVIEGGAQLSAPSGRIQLATSASPGEFDVNALQSLPNADGASFTSFGTINLAPGSSMDVSGTQTVFISGGQLVLSVNDATLNASESAAPTNASSLGPESSILTSASGAEPGANVEITLGNLNLDGSTITTESLGEGHGGNLTANVGTLSMTNGAALTSNNLASGGGGDILITSQAMRLDTGSSINSSTFNAGFGDGAGGSIVLNIGSLTLGEGTVVQSFGQTFSPGFGQGGNITIQGLLGIGSAAETVILSPGSSVSSGTFGSGDGGQLAISANSLTVDGGATINASTFGEGGGGDIVVNAQQVRLSSGSNITSHTDLFSPDAAAGGTITVQGLEAGSRADTVSLAQGSRINAEAFGEGRLGDIEVRTKTLSLTDGSTIEAGTQLDPGTAGNVTVDADSVGISSGSRVSSQAFSQDAGVVNIAASLLTLDNGTIDTATHGLGRGGDVVLNLGSIGLTNGSSISSSTTAAGRAGDITINASHGVTLDGASSMAANTTEQGSAGNVLLSADTFNMANGSQISTSARPPEVFLGQPSDLTGNAGNIEVMATSNFAIASGSTITSASQTGGNAGTVNITAPNFTLNNSILTTSTSNSGNAGSILAKVGNLSLNNEAEISSSSTGDATGAAGSVTIEGLASPADTLTMSDSVLLTRATNTGQGGSITVDVANLALNNATISASVNAIPDGFQPTDGVGNVDIMASTMSLKGSTVTTESSGSRNAGDIRMNPDVAGGSFEMQNSLINTSAGLSDGGNIEANFNNLFRMTDSVVTSSVGNPAKTDTQGGNITIDPDNVILQNSQIIAQAFAGTGGNISIVSNVFLADPFSVVDASSALGISGTVDIRSPVSNISGVIGRLPESVLASQALLRAACAARLAESKVSSFVERGRDHIPIGPEGLLATPYIPLASEPSLHSGSLNRRSDIQMRRVIGQDPMPRVHVLSGDVACGS